jgi:hypothetical protein
MFVFRISLLPSHLMILPGPYVQTWSVCEAHKFNQTISLPLHPVTLLRVLMFCLRRVGGLIQLKGK